MAEPLVEEKIWSSLRLSDLRAPLVQYEQRIDTSLPEEWRRSIQTLIDSAVSDGDQELAKMGWCLRQVGGIQDGYLRAYWLMKDGHYYTAWCEMARTESAIRALWRHFEDRQGRMGIRFIQAQIARFLLVFPYRFFWSPDLLVLERRCSICGQQIKPRSRCEHKRGDTNPG